MDRWEQSGHGDGGKIPENDDSDRPTRIASTDRKVIKCLGISSTSPWGYFKKEYCSGTLSDSAMIFTNKVDGTIANCPDREL
jgi:hypothetical protein